ncbi:MAG: 5'-deoxynucleotidase [Christensenellales bacterium]|jgi:5'-deoxynucleotidase
MRHFFAYLSRLKHISRWNLMRNVRNENVMEHTCECAMIAHSLVTLQNIRHGGSLSAERAVALAIFHEAGEVITGDLATPIKYFNPEIKEAFSNIEQIAERKICDMLPDDIKPEYQSLILFSKNEPEWKFVKAADRICAYIKCIEELKSGNEEFKKAAESTLKSIQAIDIKAVDDFMREFAPSYSLPLDELN